MGAGGGRAEEIAVDDTVRDQHADPARLLRRGWGGCARGGGCHRCSFFFVVVVAIRRGASSAVGRVDDKKRAKSQPEGPEAAGGRQSSKHNKSRHSEPDRTTISPPHHRAPLSVACIPPY